jgi:periplasmic protein TonB
MNPVIPIVGSLVVHGVLIGLMSRLDLERPKESKIIEVAVTKVKPPPPPPEPEPPPPPPPEPVKPPPPEVVPKKVKQITVKEVVPDAPPPAPQPVKPPPPPMGFSVDMSATANQGSVSVPTVEGGGNMFSDPKNKLPPGPSNKVAPPPPAGNGNAKPGTGYQITKEPVMIGDEAERTPPYPREAKALEIEGKVVLKVWVAETGRVTEVKLLKGLGYGCDEVALKWAKEKWRFEPAMAGDKPIGMWITTTMTFVLER